MSVIKAVVFDYDGVLTHWLRKDAAMYAFAAELRDQGLITAVLSNQYRPVAAIVHRLKHLDTFKTVVISCDVGVAKPNPLIYRLLLERVQLPPEACIFIDNRRRNVRAAEAVGMLSVLARNTEQAINDVRQLIQRS